MNKSGVLLLFCFCLLSTISTIGQTILEEEKKTINIQKLDDPNAIKIDGQVNEEFWMSIQANSDFVMQEPIEGGQPSERTEVRLAYDSQNLYMAVTLYDGDPGGIKAFLKKRDDDIDTEDSFTWFFDTYLDQRNAYIFAINPLGLKSDGLLTTGQGTSINKDWDGIWELKTFIGEFGWSAEIKIPFRTLNFDKNQKAWGINFRRIIRRKSEEIMWTGYKLHQGIDRPQDGGLLIGLGDINQGIGLEAKPYASLKNEKTRNQDSQTSFESGLDVNYNITTNLKASITINTDFAETDVDDRKINLTRFPLQFPEKRDFFLEGAGIYSFASRSGINPYFSRRIGLDNGRPVPISVGARILGRVGNMDMAVLQVRTGDKDHIPAEDFTVARIKQNIGKESTIGIVYTRRSSEDGELLSDPVQDRHTIATDLQWSTSRFMGNKNLQFGAFIALHNAASPLDNESSWWDRSSRGFRFNFPNRPWFGHCSYREFGIAYDPAIGFNSRNGFRRVEPSIGYRTILQNNKLIREITWRILYQNLWDLDFSLLTQNLKLNPGSIRFESGEELEIEVIRNFERLEQDFDILRDGSILIPKSEFTNWTTAITFNTAPYRKVSGSIGVHWGGFWSGYMTTLEIGTTLRPLPGINLSMVYRHTDVSLEEGKFNTDLLQLEGGYDITPAISFSSIVQYDNLSKVFSMNHRLRWIVTPGSDFYMVINHNFKKDPIDFRLLDRASVLKANYTHRF